MLSGGQKASDNAAAGATAAVTGSRSNDNRDAKKEAPMLEPTGAPDDSQKELVDDLKRQIEQYKANAANEKNLNRYVPDRRL